MLGIDDVFLLPLTAYGTSYVDHLTIDRRRGEEKSVITRMCLACVRLHTHL